MGTFKTVVIVVLTISFIVFIALFGRLPAFRKTPIGLLHRLLLRHIPNFLAQVDGVLTGGRIYRSVSSTFHYLLHEKHPVVLIFFVLLQLIGEALILPPIYPSLPLLHQLLIPPIVLTPYYLLYLCATTSSAIPVLPSPTPNTASATQQRSLTFHPLHQSALRAYPYDTLLYHPGFFCRTCAHPKPARSKHCSLCRACIQRQDHHCIWINNCVGRNNHLYFLLLLVSITILLSYGSVLGYGHLTSILTQRFAPKELLRGSLSAKRTHALWRKRMNWSQLGNAYIYAFSRSPLVGATTLLTLMCTPLAAGFLIYHVYLLWAGPTTNETQKWAEFREDVLDGLVWRARTADLLSGGVYGKDGAYESLPPEIEVPWDQVDWPPAAIPAWLWRATRQSNPSTNASPKARSASHRYRPEYWYTATTSNHAPTVTLPRNIPLDSISPSSSSSSSSSSHNPRTNSTSANNATTNTNTNTITTPRILSKTPSGSIVIEDIRWTLVHPRHLKGNQDEVGKVRNVYDLGFWGNLWDVVFHRERGR